MAAGVCRREVGTETRAGGAGDVVDVGDVGAARVAACWLGCAAGGRLLVEGWRR